MSDCVAAIEEIQLPPSSPRASSDRIKMLDSNVLEQFYPSIWMDIALAQDTHQSAEASDRQVHAHPDKSRKTAAPVSPGMRLSIPSPTRTMLTVYKIH